MLFPIIMLSLCLVGGAAFLILRKLQSRRKIDAESLVRRTANEFTNVRDIQGNLLYTLDGMALCYLKITPISIELYSKNEIQALARSLTAELSGNQEEFQLLAISRPVDISPLLAELTALLPDADRKQKELLRHEISEMNAYAISGEIVERQFYVVLWAEAGEDSERELIASAKRFAHNFTNCGIGCDLLPQQEIVRLCNLINNPAYTHMEDSDTEPSIPMLV